jgi:hypothetical protein
MFTTRLLICVLFFIGLTSIVYANEGQPKVHVPKNGWKLLLCLPNDTLPEVKSIPRVKTDSSTAKTIIKEVPKSKKKFAPVAVPVSVTVKPLKIVTPKIIKPVIKIH